jgi:hypothetical protein
MSPKLLGGCAGTRYGCCPDGKTEKVDQNGSNCPLSLSSSFNRRYDQILSGDVTIKKVSSDDYTHKITFSKKNISKVLLYQIWSDSSAELNKNRVVKEVKATTWVKSAFRKVQVGTVPSGCNTTAISAIYAPVICSDGEKYGNSSLAGCACQQNCAPFSDIPFTPTTVMELDMRNRHVFVIKRALVNKCGQVVFYVSSKDIVLLSNPCLKRLKTIPTGSFRRARFDIDEVSLQTPPQPQLDICKETGIQDQKYYFDSISNTASTITFNANASLIPLLNNTYIVVFFLPVYRNIDDIQFEYQCNQDDDCKYIPYVNDNSGDKIYITGFGAFYQDGVELLTGNNLLPDSKGFIVFRERERFEETYDKCVGSCYISLS